MTSSSSSSSSRTHLLPISSPLLIIMIIFLVSILLTASASNIKFHYTSMNPRNFTLLGDSYLKNGVVGLTREVTVPTTSCGSIIYNTPIHFFDSDSNITASFSTNFSFIISNLNPNASGDGFAFFLSSNNNTLGSPGGYLGLVNSSDLTQNRFLAVEFDTKLDAHFQDPNDNHVGLDVNSLISIRTVTLGLKGIDLRNGSLTYVWIDYKNEDKFLKVFLNYSTPKPNKPVLDIQVDLSEYLKEFMYVGFSGSTEGSTELHLIHSFGFETRGFMPLRPHFRTHNVSDTSVIVTPPVFKSRSKNHWKRIGFGLGVAGLGLFCILGIVFGVVNKKRKEMKKHKSFKAEMVTGPRQFSYRELKIATNDFHHSRILGHGAFGTVYKALFNTCGNGNGNVAAVKRSKHTHDGKTEFLAELSIIACLRHKNLVQLQGWCAEKGELLLVYDFMPNGSLDNVLYSETQIGQNPLPWPQRYNIAVGLASVLTYLHHECEQQVIHRDIKSSNVMLDANYNPKLGDFGLARLMEHDKSPVSTLTAGTMGYLAPEYLQYGKATEKTDVFSYGVVVLEVACGRRAIEREREEQKTVNLVDWAWGLHSQGKLLQCVDEKLKGEFNENEMKKLLLVGLSCVNPDCSERPNMRRVLQILKNEVSPVVVPLLKPTMIFSNSLPLSIEDIVSDDDDDQQHSPASDDLFQITVV